EIGLAGAELRVVGARVTRVERQELPVGRDGQHVVGRAALLVIRVGEGDAGVRLVLALREGVDQALVVLPARLPVLLPDRLLAGLPDALVRGARERLEVELLAGARRQDGERQDGGEGASSQKRPRSHCHSRSRPSASATLERNPRSVRAAVVSANVSLMSPFWGSWRWIWRCCPVTVSTRRNTSLRATRSPPPTLYTQPGRPESAAWRTAETMSST